MVIVVNKLNESDIVKLCVTKSYEAKSYIVKKKLIPLQNILNSIDKYYTHKLPLENILNIIAKDLKTPKAGFIKKVNLWIESYKKGLWCSRCKKAPPTKGNRFFCNSCLSLVSKQSDIDSVGSKGRVTRGSTYVNEK